MLSSAVLLRHITEHETTYKIIILEGASSHINRLRKSQHQVKEFVHESVNNKHPCIPSSCFGMGWLPLIINTYFALKKHLKEQCESHIPSAA